jgi:hypothetical protein
MSLGAGWGVSISGRSTIPTVDPRPLEPQETAGPPRKCPLGGPAVLSLARGTTP